MIRVLQMIGSLNVGGSQTMMLNIYRNIDRTKMQFDFVLDHPNETYFAEEVKAMGAKIFTMPGFNGTNASEIKRDWNNFFYTHPEYKVLHCHVRSYASLFLPVAKKHGVKTIIHCHNISGGSGAVAMAKNAMMYPLRKQADILMACSTEAGRWLYGDKACAGSKFMLLPKPVDTERFSFSEEKRRHLRESLGLEGRFILGHAGRFTEGMNHEFLLEVFAKLHKKQAMSTLLLVGEGPLQRAVAEKAVKLGVADDVIMTGSRSDMPELLSAMDAFAFPAAFEAMPGIVLEAQACALPCFVSESVSRDVDVSPLIKHLPTEDAGLWADELLKKQPARHAENYISGSVFDTKLSAGKLYELYRKLYHDAKA